MNFLRRNNHSTTRFCVLSLCLWVLTTPPCRSFSPVIKRGMRERGAAPTQLIHPYPQVEPFAVAPSTPTVASSTALQMSTDTKQEDVESMRIGAIKQELESYGISTKAFLEKSELVEALKKARADGLKPKDTAAKSSASSSSSDSSSSSTTTSSETSEKDSRPREERLKEEVESCQKMKNSELKQELKERGINTASFFEKSEFVQALAEARVDGVNKKGGGSSGSDGESYAEYPDVEVLTDDSPGPRPKGAGEKQQSSSSSPFGGGGGGSPFGGAAGGSPFGGAGMGGFADMLKNMQGGGGAAAGGNPFGGAGGNPFGGGMGGMGDAMGKAQEMMKNPKVMELMTKAQKNPKVMKAMQECMSNPAAISKYQNDPEIAELVNELKKYM